MMTEEDDGSPMDDTDWFLHVNQNLDRYPTLPYWIRHSLLPHMRRLATRAVAFDPALYPYVLARAPEVALMATDDDAALCHREVVHQWQFELACLAVRRSQGEALIHVPAALLHELTPVQIFTLVAPLRACVHTHAAQWRHLLTSVPHSRAVFKSLFTKSPPMRLTPDDLPASVRLHPYLMVYAPAILHSDVNLVWECIRDSPRQYCVLHPDVRGDVAPRSRHFALAEALITHEPMAYCHLPLSIRASPHSEAFTYSVRLAIIASISVAALYDCIPVEVRTCAFTADSHPILIDAAAEDEQFLEELAHPYARTVGQALARWVVRMSPWCYEYIPDEIVRQLDALEHNGFSLGAVLNCPSNYTRLPPCSPLRHSSLVASRILRINPCLFADLPRAMRSSPRWVNCIPAGVLKRDLWRLRIPPGVLTHPEVSPRFLRVLHRSLPLMLEDKRGLSCHARAKLFAHQPLAMRLIRPHAFDAEMALLGDMVVVLLSGLRRNMDLVRIVLQRVLGAAALRVLRQACAAPEHWCQKRRAELAEGPQHNPKKRARLAAYAFETRTQQQQ